MNKHLIENIVIYSFSDLYIGANTYVIIQNNIALVIDPVESSEFQNFINNSEINEVIVLLTHEHFDHTIGLSLLKENYKTTIICQKNCSEKIGENSRYAPIFVSYIASLRDDGAQLLEMFNKSFKPYSFKGDVVFDDEYIFEFFNLKFKMVNLKGHSEGGCLIFLGNSIVFSGDSILKNIPIVTKLPGGNKKEFLNSSVPFLERLDKSLIVFPGHGDKFILNELFINDKIQLLYK